MQAQVLIDSTSYTFYRVTATSAWWGFQGRTPLKDLLEDTPEHREFLETLKTQSLSCLQRFSKLLGISISEMLLVRDCPRESIWRLKHYSSYKSNRASESDVYGKYIKHLNSYHATLFPLLLRIDEAEADDTIAILVQYFKYRDPDCQVSILANDSDYEQLLEYSGVSIYNPKTKFKLVECASPAEALRHKVYHGDKSDNVPPIPHDAPYPTVLRNNLLVNFSYIPRYIQDRVIGQYHVLIKDLAHTPTHRPLPVQLGLCCINTKLHDRKIFCSRTIRLQTIVDKGLDELFSRAIQNCKDLITHIEWNATHGIRVMRISSDLFPHMNNPKAPPYTLDFAHDLLLEIGRLARLYRQRLTFHPGQYNVVGTPDEQIFQNTCAELDWHAQVLDTMGCDQDSVIVVHGGGVYGDKPGTIERWAKNFARLPERVQRRLVLENCEKSFSVTDCLQISRLVNIPVVFDTHHFECYIQLHPKERFLAPECYMQDVLATWTRRHIKPKFHVSEQCEDKQIGAHSDFISEIPQYLLDIPKLYGISIDIMIEAKQKEQAIEQLYLAHPELNPVQVRKIKARLRRLSEIPEIPDV